MRRLRTSHAKTTLNAFLQSFEFDTQNYWEDPTRPQVLRHEFVFTSTNRVFVVQNHSLSQLTPPKVMPPLFLKPDKNEAKFSVQKIGILVEECCNKWRGPC